MNERINLQDDTRSAVMKMADGNPGAITAMVQILTDGNQIDPDNIMGGMGNILSLDTIGIYGSDIYILWNDVCEKDLTKVITLLRGHQLGFISAEVLKDVSGRQDRSGKGIINIDGIYKKVCDKLPNFDRENR